MEINHLQLKVIPLLFKLQLKYENKHIILKLKLETKPKQTLTLTICLKDVTRLCRAKVLASSGTFPRRVLLFIRHTQLLNQAYDLPDL